RAAQRLAHGTANGASMSLRQRVGSTVVIRSGAGSAAFRKALPFTGCPRPKFQCSALMNWSQSGRSFSLNSWRSCSSACRSWLEVTMVRSWSPRSPPLLPGPKALEWRSSVSVSPSLVASSRSCRGLKMPSSVRCMRPRSSDCRPSSRLINRSRPICRGSPASSRPLARSYPVLLSKKRLLELRWRRPSWPWRRSSRMSMMLTNISWSSRRGCATWSVPRCSSMTSHHPSPHSYQAWRPRWSSLTPWSARWAARSASVPTSSPCVLWCRSSRKPQRRQSRPSRLSTKLSPLLLRLVSPWISTTLKIRIVLMLMSIAWTVALAVNISKNVASTSTWAGMMRSLTIQRSVSYGTSSSVTWPKFTCSPRSSRPV
ncbi:unnamed protein product, partial [Prorocentrum cordatum]